MDHLRALYANLSPAIKRYLVVGVSAYIIELAVIYVALTLGTSAVVAVALSFWTGLLFSFTLQKLFTFGDRRIHHKILLPQIAAFCMLVLFNFCFTIGMTKLFAHLLPAVVTRTMAIGITTIWNFYIYKTQVFGKSESAVID
jgi:putative flippase GtrA